MAEQIHLELLADFFNRIGLKHHLSQCPRHVCFSPNIGSKSPC